VTTFGTDLRAEFRRLFRSPYDDLLVVVGNAAIVCAGWFLLPESARQWLFTLTGPMAFAVVLETWMLADTPSTNMLGNDPEAALAVLPDRPRLTRFLRVKSVALACLVGPPCAVVAAAIAVREGRDTAGALLACVLLVVPFGVPVVAAWFGTVLPYHPRSLRWRLERRRPYRRTVRWLLLVVAPYAVVPVVLLAFITPAVLLGLAVGRREQDGSLDRLAVATAAAAALLITATAIALAPRVAGWLAARRRRTLTDYLADPDRG
jgi:hypothetical protein